MTTRPRLRGVAVGAGYFAAFHHEAWSRIPDVEVVAVCDRSEERARQVMARHGIPRAYTDAGAMLDAERPDFIDIITPPSTHEALCAAAASRGVHIICQKPLAPSLDEARRIVETAEAAGVRLLVHENFRWQPWYRQVKRIQTAGEIGTFTHLHLMTRLGDGWAEDAYLGRQPYFREYPRLLVHETGVHFIDTFRFLLGEMTSVCAQLRRLNPAIRGEDAGVVLFTFASGATAIWDASRYNESEAASPRYTFGEMRIDASGGHVTLDGSSTMRIKPLGEPARDVDYAREDRNFGGDCVFALQQHFVACIRSGAPFESGGREYLQNIRIVDAVYASAARGDVVRVEAGAARG